MIKVIGQPQKVKNPNAPGIRQITPAILSLNPSPPDRTTIQVGTKTPSSLSQASGGAGGTLVLVGTCLFLTLSKKESTF